jgi:hypothetical protein
MLLLSTNAMVVAPVAPAGARRAFSLVLKRQERKREKEEEEDDDAIA